MTPPTKDHTGSNVLIKNENTTMLAISKPKRIKKVVSKFVMKTIPIIIGDPDHESLNYKIQALYANVATLPTNLTGGKHGHSGLIVKCNLYATL